MHFDSLGSAVSTSNLLPFVTPLTTTFIPSATCLSDYYAYPNAGDQYEFLGPPVTSDCLPSGWTSTSQFFSTGLCPSGYVIAASTKVSLDSVRMTETQALCCPSSYTADAITTADGCYRKFSAGFSVFNLTTILTDANGDVATSTASTTLTTDSAINAFGVSIRFRAGDFGGSKITVLTTESSTTSSTTSALLTAASSLTTTSVANIMTQSTAGTASSLTAPSSSGNSKTGLSLGAKAGVGIGVAFVFIAALSVFIIFFIRHRRRADDLKATSELAVYTKETPSELYTNDSRQSSGHSEPSAELYAEGSYRTAVAELEDVRSVYELGI